MYGSLQEIDVSGLLNFFSEQQKSGIFLIETTLLTDLQKNIYFIFFLRGDIVFAGDIDSFDFQRIKEYLSYYNLTDQFNQFQKKLNQSGSIAEYEAILELHYQRLLSQQQLKQIYQQIIEEILFRIINLKTGRFIWQNTFNLQPSIMTLDIKETISSIIEKQITWNKFFPYIQQIDQCPIIAKGQEDFLSKNIEQNLFTCLNGKTSFIQLSRLLNYNFVEIAKILYPHIQRGRIKLINPQVRESDNNMLSTFNAQIIGFSINNKWTLNTKKISYFERYKCLTVDDINQFFMYILNLPIKVIILQSKIENNDNTYNLCKIIRNNEKTCNVPIIMVVNKYLFKDNLISKMYGVTEYISENIFQKRMLKIIDRYL